MKEAVVSSCACTIDNCTTNVFSNCHPKTFCKIRSFRPNLDCLISLAVPQMIFSAIKIYKLLLISYHIKPRCRTAVDCFLIVLVYNFENSKIKIDFVAI